MNPKRIYHFVDMFNALPAERIPHLFSGWKQDPARCVYVSGVTLGNPLSPAEICCYAEINPAPLPGHLGWQGRWIAVCISKECGSAEYVTPVQPIFMCTRCWNRDFDHQWVKVAFPEDREEIERLLLNRPAQNRFYKQGETLAGIKQENIRHGCEV